MAISSENDGATTITTDDAGGTITLQAANVLELTEVTFDTDGAGSDVNVGSGSELYVTDSTFGTALDRVNGSVTIGAYEAANGGEVWADYLEVNGTDIYAAVDISFLSDTASYLSAVTANATNSIFADVTAGPFAAEDTLMTAVNGMIGIAATTVTIDGDSSLVATDADADNNGSVSIIAEGDIDLSTTLTVPTNLIVSANNDITIASNSGDITLGTTGGASGSMTSTEGDIDLSSGGNTTQVTGTITATAGNVTAVALGDYVQAPGTAVAAGTDLAVAPVSIDITGANVVLDTLTTVDGDGSTVTVTATGPEGDITVSDVDAAADITADNVVLTAVGSIGSDLKSGGVAAPINISSAELIAANTTGKDAVISLTSTNANAVVLTASTLGENSDIYFAHIDTNTTDLSNLLTLASVTTVNGDVNVTSNVTVDAVVVYAYDSDSLNGPINGIEDDAHSISITTSGADINTFDVQADYDVVLTTNGGDIVIGAPGIIAGNDVIILPGGGTVIIGPPGPGPVVPPIVTSGDVVVYQAGDILLSDFAIDAGGNVTLTSTQGSILEILDAPGPDVGPAEGWNIRAGGNITLWVGNHIGRIDPSEGGPDPLDVVAGGTLSVGAFNNSPNFPDRYDDSFWAFIRGSSGDDSIHYLGGPGGTPPGIIEWNGMAWGGPETALLELGQGEMFISEMRAQEARYEKNVWNFGFLYFPHIWGLMDEVPGSMSIEWILDGKGTIQGLPAGVGPTEINMNDLDNTFSYNK